MGKGYTLSSHDKSKYILDTYKMQRGGKLVMHLKLSY